MKEKFQELDVAKIVIDIDEFEQPWDFLAEHYNRSNIPVNVIYPPNLDRLPIILPEFIGPGQVLEGIEKAQ